MSIKLMSAIFETEFRDLPYTKDGEEHKAKASTCKLLLLAIADHANDYGESAYPGYDRLEIKTALSRQGIADTLQALTQNGLLSISDKPSRLQTNNYTIILSSLPTLKNEIIDESSHLTDTSQATLLGRVKPLDPNHQLTIIKTPNISFSNLQGIEASIYAGRPTTQEDINASNKDTWRGRELLGDNYLPYGDWWHAKTGLHMYGAKAKAKVDAEWLNAFKAWYEFEITIPALDEAYQANEWRKVSKPSQITADAKLVQAAPKKTDVNIEPKFKNGSGYV